MSVTRAQLCEFATLCGQDSNRVRSMIYNGGAKDSIEFELYLENEQGRRYVDPLVPNKAATEWVTVPISDS